MSVLGQAYVNVVTTADTAETVASAVKDALNDPAVFFYGALFSLEKTQRLLRDSTLDEDHLLLQLLEIMAYGTVSDLRRSGLLASSLNAIITPDLTNRLLVLSLLTYCATLRGDEPGLSYDAVAVFLDVADDDALEAVVRHGVSHHLLKARLHPQQRRIYIEDFAARCVRARDVTVLKHKLQEWLRVIDGQLDGLSMAKDGCTEGSC